MLTLPDRIRMNKAVQRRERWTVPGQLTADLLDRVEVMAGRPQDASIKDPPVPALLEPVVKGG